MGRRKRNKHANQNTKAKTKASTGEKKQNKEIGLRATAAHALSSGWVQNSGIGLLFVLIALMVDMYFRRDVRTTFITFALAATAFIWIFAIVGIKYWSADKPQQLAFSLQFKNFEGSMNPLNGVFWFRYPSAYGDTLSPASAALYMTVKNTSSSPVYIERLELSVQKEGESWSVLRRMPGDLGPVYWIYGDLTKARLLNMSNLDQKITTSLPPGETIHGWTFWACTEPYPVSEGDMIRWRIRAKDSSGEESEYISPYEEISNKPNTDPAMRQPVPIPVTGVTHDLSKLTIRYFAAFPYK